MSTELKLIELTRLNMQQLVEAYMWQISQTHHYLHIIIRIHCIYLFRCIATNMRLKLSNHYNKCNKYKLNTISVIIKITYLTGRELDKSIETSLKCP